MSRNILGRATKAGSFSEAMPPLSELPPPEARGKSKIADFVNRQREEIRQAARAEGYEEGFRSGLEDGAERAFVEAEARYREEIAAFAERLAEHEQAFEDFVGECERRLAILAIVIAERLVRRELEHSREAAYDIARDVVSEIRDGTRIRIRVNPMDAGLIEGRKAEILEACSGLRTIDVVVDRSIQAGCVVETDAGLIDGRIEAALERLALGWRGEAK